MTDGPEYSIDIKGNDGDWVSAAEDLPQVKDRIVEDDCWSRGDDAD